MVTDMPRVEVLIQVVDDDRSNLAHSRFQIGDTATRVLTERVSPLELVQDLGEIFVTSLHDQFPNIGFQVLPGELHVTSSQELPESYREVLQRRLAPFARHPLTPEVREAIQREVEAFIAGYPDQIVLLPSMNQNARMTLPEVDFAEVEARVISGLLPEVSMEARVGGPSVTEEDLEGVYQVPAPPEESNPSSRRIRQALRQVVDGEVDNRTRILSQLHEQGSLSRRTLLAHFGLSETSTQEELEEALRQPPLEIDQIRGRRTVGAMLDDAATFGVPMAQGDTPLSFDRTPAGLSRSQGALETFRILYGGDEVQALHGDEHYRSAGMEPPFQPKPQPRARVREIKPPEDRTDIPTRYQRKPVI